MSGRNGDLPEAVRASIERWLDVHDTIAPGLVEGLYLVGSVALGDWQPHSDVDVVVAIADPSDPDLPDQLRSVHDRLGATLPVPVDGPYVGWGDLVVPPVPLQRPYVLDGVLHFDAEEFEINPVTWYTLATYGIAMRGAAPAELEIHLDAGERRSWVAENVDTYWRDVGEQVERRLAADDAAGVFDGGTHAWIALGVARMLYTFETGDVASKSAAGRWASDRLPEFADVFAVALAQRRSPTSVARADVERLIDLVTHVTAHIAASR